MDYAYRPPAQLEPMIDGGGCDLKSVSNEVEFNLKWITMHDTNGENHLVGLCSPCKIVYWALSGILERLDDGSIKPIAVRL